MVTRWLGVMVECDARTEGASIPLGIGVTEDAAACRPVRPDSPSDHCVGSSYCPKYAARAVSRGHYDGPVRTVKRIAAGVGLFLGGVAYIWYAGVRSVPAVKRRKEIGRASCRERV